MTRTQELSRKAADERRRCRDWLLPFMENGRARVTTKAEFYAVAMRELGVSKASFDFAWTDAIERTGRHDWYQPIKPKGSAN
jgi:hypothetical protein